MSVSGLVVSVADSASAERVAELVRCAGSFTLGPRVGERITVALEAADGRSAAQKHEWLRQLPGVVKVDVAFVYADPAEEVARAN
jgi:nitrate reductase NapAB chaperone NapD